METESTCKVITEGGIHVPIVVPNKILVFAPHPDDELISCGGTILKYTSFGASVVVVLMTPGSGGYTKEEDKEQIIAIREQEYRNATKNLNVADFINLKLDEVEIKRDNVNLVTNLIRNQAPDIILAPHPAETHRTHRNTSLLVKEGVYHAVTGSAYGGYGKNVRPLGFYYYESPSCKFSYVHSSIFVVADISAYWTEKVGIFNNAYASQAEMLERVMAWAEKTSRLRGEEISCEFGEAFVPDTEYVPLKLLLM